ncbi:natural killer cell receptor 2B4 isoform X3 [Nycticebus coucang]|uniref:natural killer cell receptor 2B4 isoform X3 n=1 Tax=Nycticebus coucang TaxID=9470 RepID=UPI00234E2EEB|nr:natural killer cell receptor 2B4 isoform X3 [Nycticebus coucang]
MLRPAVTLIILLFLKMPQGQGCPGSTSDVVGLSGQSLQLQPKITQMKIYSVVWKRQLSSPSAYQHILSWENGSKPKNESLTWTIFNNKFSFRTENLTLLINTAQEQDSGSYCLEVTNESGRVWTAKFQVSVFDRVEKPHLQEQEKVLDRGRCQVSLYCLVSRDRNVTYSWYRGSKFIHKARNLTYLKEEIDNNMYTYTCNVSNPVSWNSHSLNLTASCQSVQQETSPEECLTIYEDVKDLKTTRNHKQKPKQNSPEKKSTIYSMIQPQSSVPTSQDVSNTLYSFIQPSRKSGSKKRNQNPPFGSTVYEEVGNREPKAQNPAQLSHKELESFAVYS